MREFTRVKGRKGIYKGTNVGDNLKGMQGYKTIYKDNFKGVRKFTRV